MEQPLPKAIQAEVDAAAEIEKQMTGQEPPQPEDQPAEPSNTPAPVEPPVSSEPTSPGNAPAPVETVNWEQKYKALAGKYNAEVPQLHTQLREQTTKVTDLEKEVTQLRKPSEPPAPKPQLVTPKDEEAFGADLVDLILRGAKQATRDDISLVLLRIEQLDQRFSKLETLPQQVESVAHRQEQTDEDRFWGQVNVQIPDWDSVDQDPRWVAFLNTTPPFTKRTYRALAQDAIDTFDPSPVVEMVKVWRQQIGEPVVTTEQKEEVDEAQQELNRQVAPSKSSASSVTSPSGKIWTGKEYEQAFDPRLSNTMSQEEIDKLQVEAERAQEEGRVRW